jgi:hypothetical protein
MGSVKAMYFKSTRPTEVVRQVVRSFCTVFGRMRRVRRKFLAYRRNGPAADDNKQCEGYNLFPSRFPEVAPGPGHKTRHRSSSE